MNRKAIFVAMIVLSLLVLLSNASGAVAQSPTSSGTISYSGRLNNDAGHSVTDGVYAFTFALYDSATGGNLLWSETQTGVSVKNGAFTARLGSVTPLPKEARIAKGWLAVSVRGPSETTFTTLAPRQELNAALPASTSSPTAGASCPHDHWGEAWSGNSTGTGLQVTNTKNNGTGIVAVADNGSNAWAVWGESNDGRGVYGSSTNGRGMYAESVNGYGVYASSYANAAVWAEGPNAVVGVSSTGGGYAAVVGRNTSNGIGVAAESYSGLAFKAISGGPTLMEGWNNGGPTRMFRLDSTGKGFFNGGYQTGGADLAEFIAVTDNPQPSDVVEIDPDHPERFRLAATPNSTAVAGVISTNPGTSLGAIDPAGAENTGPQLALAGRVPVKASAENGTIRPGDLLVASSTPGHAMRAPVNPAPGTVIGKALGSLNSNMGIVQMLIMLR